MMRMGMMRMRMSITRTSMGKKLRMSMTRTNMRKLHMTMMSTMKKLSMSMRMKSNILLTRMPDIRMNMTHISGRHRSMPCRW